MSKRTVINADEELVIKGKLTIEGNVTQIETTQQVTNLQGNVFTINSDSSNTSAVLALNSNGTEATLTFDDANGSVVFNKPINVGTIVLSATGNITAPYFIGNVIGTVSSIANHTTTNLAEGSNLYFTEARVRGNVSVVDAGGDGSLAYNTSSGVFTYTGPSSAEVRAHFSATSATGITYNSANGVFALASIPNSSLTNSSITVNGYSTALGGTVTLDTDDVAEGSNLYYTSARANSAMDAYLVGGDGIDITSGNVSVDSTVVRTSGNQSIAGNKTFTGTTYVTGNIEPTAANTYNLGSWANHFGYVFANVLHAEYLDLEDANIADIHNSFYVGSASNASITRSGYGLTFTHNASGAYYEVNAGDGLQISGNNVAVDNTVVRTTGDQTITGNISLTGNLAITGNLDVTANINSLTVVDLLVQDSNIVLNSNAATGADAYVKVERGGDPDVFIKWDDTTDNKWKFTNDGSNVYNIPVTTTDLVEGNNLYFTTGRVNSAIDAYLIGGDGLTYSSGNISIGAGLGITVNADNVAVNATYIKNLFSITDAGGDGSLSYDSANGIITYTGPSASEVRAHFSGGDGIDLTNGVIDVDTTVVRTTGDQSLANVKSFTGELVIPQNGISPTNNGSIYHDNVDVYAVLNGAAIKLTPQSDVGEIEDVGSSGIDIYAGYRLVSVGNANVKYHGIKSITNSTYTSISEASNVITVDGNISAIRAAFSASNVAGYGGISYSNTTGAFSYTGISDAQVRGLISGSGLVSYDSANGIITTSADNYGGWTVQTDSGSGAAESITSSEILQIVGGTNITVTNTGNVVTITNDNVADIESVSAGDGLTGGGNNGNVTLDVGAGDGIIVNTNNVAVNVSYVRNQFSASGDLSYNASTGVFSFTNDAGDIEGVTAGNGLVGGGTTGTVTLDIGGGTGITVNADNIAVNMNAFSTTDLAEGANLYFSNARVNAFIQSSITTTDIDEGANLYYTSSRANSAMDAYLVGGSGLTYSSGTFAVGAGNYILVGANDVAVDATTTATASKVVARDSTGNVYANYFVGTATAAQYADLAENYLADGDYSPGTVLVFGGSEEVTAAMTFESTRIAGVVTTQPAHVMNSHLTGEHVVCIALRGRVPVKVKGIVRKGDVLVSAGEGHTGYAVASLDPRNVPAAAIVGKAIGEKLDAGPGIVEALI